MLNKSKLLMSLMSLGIAGVIFAYAPAPDHHDLSASSVSQLDVGDAGPEITPDG